MSASPTSSETYEGSNGVKPVRRVMLLGSGWRFTSGISYYTCRLANAMADRHDTSVITMRRLVPRALYPGRRRVGRKVHALEYDSRVDVLDGVDWYWGMSMLRAIKKIRGEKPEVVVLEWWTGAVLHSYLMLAWVAKRAGARIFIEWHEVQDTGEATLPGVRKYVSLGMRRLLRLTSGHLVHSPFDLDIIRSTFPLAGAVAVAPHGPYDHLQSEPDGLAAAPAQDGRMNVLFFGIIRPYKGLEDLIAAYDLLSEDIASRIRLTVVGETWEGWTAPIEAIQRSPRKDSIELVNRYVTDDEVSRVFAQADAVALPYRRSSASGPLHIAMSHGLPVLVSDVGGLRSAAGDYEGTVFVQPEDPVAISEGLTTLLSLAGRRFDDPHSWSVTVSAFERLFANDQSGKDAAQQVD